MELTQRQSLDKIYSLEIAKNFLIWCFTLTVCFLVVGFPVVVLMVTIGSLAAIILQSVLSISSVLLVAGSLMGINIFGILIGAAVLAVKRVNPQDISWLSWLHGTGTVVDLPVYASCPLTCNLTR